MYFLKSSVCAAALFAVALAQSTLKITQAPSSVQGGKSYVVKWTGGDGSPATIVLRKGPSNNLKTIATLTTSGTDGSFVWNVDNSLETDNDYALQISEGNESNYWAVSVAAAGTASTGHSTSSSASSTSSHASSTGVSSSSGSSTSGSSSSGSSTRGSSTSDSTRSSHSSVTPSSSSSTTSSHGHSSNPTTESNISSETGSFESSSSSNGGSRTTTSGSGSGATSAPNSDSLANNLKSNVQLIIGAVAAAALYLA